MDIDTILKKHGYQNRPNFAEIARWAAKHGHFANETELLQAVSARFGTSQAKIGMRERPAPYKLWTDPELPVDGNAIDQLKTALALPVAIGGAGMPDLHKGYSLPIGGVVVLDNAISPAFVGYDISCMMMLTILDLGGRHQPEDLEQEPLRQEYLNWVLKSTSFGVGSVTHGVDHPVMDAPLWRESRYLRGLKDLAASQVGSSGAGNHFADIVLGKPLDGEPFIGLLTHSGSRGVGNKVGHHFSALADQAASEKYKFPSGYGWFDLETEAGQEYKLERRGGGSVHAVARREAG